MIYKIKQRVFSLGDGFTIKNSEDEDMFIVKSQVFSIGKKLKIFDLYGEELVYIEQKLFKFLPEYHI